VRHEEFVQSSRALSGLSFAQASSEAMLATLRKVHWSTPSDSSEIQSQDLVVHASGEI